MLQQPLIVLDFETTGLKPHEGDRITEVGLVRIEDGQIVDRYQSLANCGVRIPHFITAFTGINQQMVDDAPSVATVMREVMDFIGDLPVVAHSASFDERFFAFECSHLHLRTGIEPFLCSMRIARRVYPDLESHALAVLAHALKLPKCGAPHRAATDAELTAQLMLRLGRDLAELRPGLAVTTDLLRQLMRLPVTPGRTGLEKLCA